MATFYLDFENGNDSNDGLSFANRWKTITNGATAARTAPGDIIRIMKSPDPVSLGVNGTFTKQSATITLASAVTQNISTCETAWVASTNVTTTTSATRKEGSLSTSIAPNASFTTGVMAYLATGTLNLSAYQNVTFWIRTSIALAANVLRLDLCSDAAGATPVHSITIDTAFTANTWKPVTWKNGAALSTSIQSIALRALSTPGAQTILLDNIIATNDLHFNSLIGTSSSATSTKWYPIRSINGTTVSMEVSQNGSEGASTMRGWSETTTTTTAYARPTIQLTSIQTVNEAGLSSAYIEYSGGWDRTNMSTQDGLTILAADANLGSRVFDFALNGVFLIWRRIGTLWGQTYCNTGSNLNFFDIQIYGTTGTPLSNSWDIYIENPTIIGCGSQYNTNAGTVINGAVIYAAGGAYGISMSSGVSVLKNSTILNSSTSNIEVRSVGFLQNIVSNDSNSFGLSNLGYAEVNGWSSSGNSGAGINSSGVLRLNNATINDSTNFWGTTSIMSIIAASRYSTYKAVINSASSLVVRDSNAQVHGSTSISWGHDPTANHRTYIPVIQTLQPFAVNASTLVTFSIWVYRTSTNVEGRVRLRGYVTPGVDADVTATITAPINTWQQLTVTCTPTAAGVVQIDLESYSVNGSTGTVYFGDASVSQA